MKIKKIDLAQIMSIGANLGVIAGIIFLGLELRAIHDQMDAQISFNRFSEELATRRLMAVTPSLARVIAKTAAGEEVSHEESVMLDSYVASILVQAEYGWLQYQAGRTKENDIQVIVRRIKNDFWGMAGTWNRMKGAALDADFVAAVERELEK